MNTEQTKAAIKGAAYMLASLIGWSKAVKFLHEVATDIENDAWHAGRD